MASADLDASVVSVEALRGALSMDEGLVDWVDVHCEELGRVGVCSGNEDCRHIQNVSCQPSGNEGPYKLGRGDEHLQVRRTSCLQALYTQTQTFS